MNSKLAVFITDEMHNALWAAVAVKGGATIAAGLCATGCALVPAVVLVPLAMIRRGAFAQWLESYYTGKLPSGRYTDPGTERRILAS